MQLRLTLGDFGKHWTQFRTRRFTLKGSPDSVGLASHLRSSSLASLLPNMRTPSNKLLAELSYHIRIGATPAWKEFGVLWSAFNAIYGGEPNSKERARVMACIRRHFSERVALRTLRAVTKSIDKILALPPGNMLLEIWDPRFRAASQRCIGLYRDPRETAVTRLAAVGGVLYQVRCNLIHGSKDPRSPRDLMLVQESVMCEHRQILHDARRRINSSCGIGALFPER